MAPVFCPTFKNAVFFMVGLSLAIVISELGMIADVEVSMVDERQEERIELFLEQSLSVFPLLQDGKLSDDAPLAATLAPRCDVGVADLESAERKIDRMLDAEIERRKRVKEKEEKREREEIEAKQTFIDNLEFEELSQEFQERIHLLQFPKDWFCISSLFTFVFIIHHQLFLFSFPSQIFDLILPLSLQFCLKVCLSPFPDGLEDWNGSHDGRVYPWSHSLLLHGQDSHHPDQGRKQLVTLL